MSLLKNLKTDDSIANEKDSVGNSGPLESGLYMAKVALAYLTKSKGGALGLVLNANTDAGREIRSTIYVTSGTEKGGQNFYTDKDGAKQYLPGFLLANSLALLTVGKELSDLDTEQKVVNVYSPEAKAEVPTKVDMVTDLLGQDILIGLIKQTVDKTVKNDAGAYVPTGETRDENEIDKFFRARDKMTTAEIRAQAAEAAFVETWDAKWTGVTRNRAKGAAGAGLGAGVAGNVGGSKSAAANAPSAKKPARSLFA
jgi:hypothetical protein